MSFENFEKILKKIDDEFTHFTTPSEVREELIRLREREQAEGRYVNARSAHLEAEFLSFYLKDGKVLPAFSGKKNDANFAFPDLEKYGDEEIGYLKKRFEQTENKVLKARYAQIMWNSKFKNRDYGKKAVEMLCENVKQTLKNLLPRPSATAEVNAANEIRNAFALALNVKHMIDRATQIVRDALDHSLTIKDGQFFLKSEIIEIMIHHSKNFEMDWNYLESRCEELSTIDESIGRKKRFVALGKNIAMKKRENINVWVRREAELIELDIEQLGTRSKLAAAQLCTEAVILYKKCGDIKKAESLMSVYEQLISEATISPIDFDIEMPIISELQTSFSALGREAAMAAKNNLSMFLSVISDVIPDTSRLMVQSQESYYRYPLQNMLPKTILDSRMHAAKQVTDEDAKLKSSFWSMYRIEMSLKHVPYMQELFKCGISSNYITAENLLAFFKDHSWLGQKLKILRNGEQREYCWIDQIMPPITYYLNEVRKVNEFPDYVPDLIMPTDSLCLKLEGIMRDIIGRSSGLPTSKIKSSKTRGSVVREQDITQLLSVESLRSVFSMSELNFFKYVLVEHEGLNIRNNVAHCLFQAEDYSQIFVPFLMVMLFQIGKLPYFIDSKGELILLETPVADPA